jgi:hypothetical protein
VETAVAEFTQTLKSPILPAEKQKPSVSLLEKDEESEAAQTVGQGSVKIFV